uniref:Uncharacterized protein n=1 Tax=Ditylenchus dipsaci TaxID=166011 RepID=A0A915CLX1_9BILA
MPVNAAVWGSRACLILLFIFCIVFCDAAPSQKLNVPRDKDKSNGLQYTISRAEPAAEDLSDIDQSASSPNNGFMRALEKSGIVQSVMNAFQKPNAGQQPVQLTKQRVANNSKLHPPQLQHDQPTVQQAPDFGLSSFNLDAFAPDENVWKKTLFGPSGLLTEIFNVVNDKRKESVEKTGKSQADPDLSPEPSTDFSKILDSLLSKLNCGDIYKAVDEFRKSELFSNFQVCYSCSNPELIENFTSKSNIQELLGGAGGSPKSKAKSAAPVDSKSLGEVKSGDGDLGVDFSHLVDELPAEVDKDSKVELPEIAESVDSPDYYSSVDTTGEEVERLVEPSKAHKKTATSPAILSSQTMPEIAESIDSVPEEFESVVVEKQEVVSILEKANQVPNLEAMLQVGEQ